LRYDCFQQRGRCGPEIISRQCALFSRVVAAAAPGFLRPAACRKPVNCGSIQQQKIIYTDTVFSIAQSKTIAVTVVLGAGCERMVRARSVTPDRPWDNKAAITDLKMHRAPAGNKRYGTLSRLQLAS
jgi:hypothetical protein